MCVAVGGGGGGGTAVLSLLLFILNFPYTKLLAI